MPWRITISSLISLLQSFIFKNFLTPLETSYPHSVDMCCHGDALVQRVCQLYEQISSLKSLKPSQDVNTLFTQLVLTCMPPNPIDVNTLCQNVQEIRANLIKLCGEAEGLLESHFSTILGSYPNPIHHLDIFPYYSNYLKLSKLEHSILTQHFPHVPSKIAFVGSGPLPLTSIVLASKHLTATTFHNYDIDSLANSKAIALVASDPDLSARMVFHTSNIMDVTNELKEYEVVFLAALVGMDKSSKVKIIEHLAENMKHGAILMLRSAHGARAFLYPIVDPCEDLVGFEVLDVFHPTDEVINSVVIARRSSTCASPTVDQKYGFANVGNVKLPNKCCSEVEGFDPLKHGKNMIEELVFDQE